VNWQIQVYKPIHIYDAWCSLAELTPWKSSLLQSFYPSCEVELYTHNIPHKKAVLH